MTVKPHKSIDRYSEHVSMDESEFLGQKIRICSAQDGPTRGYGIGKCGDEPWSTASTSARIDEEQPWNMRLGMLQSDVYSGNALLIKSTCGLLCGMGD